MRRSVKRKLQPLALEHLSRLPGACPGCAFWETPDVHERACGSICDQEAVEAWFRRVGSEWGSCGRVATHGDEVLGVIKYAPSGLVPQAATFPAAPLDPNVVLITCIHIRDDARQHGLGRVLLQATLRDLIARGERTVEAFGAARSQSITTTPTIGMEFLVRQGFTVSRPDPSFPLMRLDLKSLAVWSENLETVLNSLRMPLRSPRGVPSPSAHAQPPGWDGRMSRRGSGAVGG